MASTSFAGSAAVCDCWRVTREHTIRDEPDLARHIDYIHFNPVKHGYVTRARDWPHSSFHRFVAEGILPADWGGHVGELLGAFGE
jgi:putative transposase